MPTRKPLRPTELRPVALRSTELWSAALRSTVLRPRLSRVRPKNVLFRRAAVVTGVLAAALTLTFAAAAPANAAGPNPISPTELSKATNAAYSGAAITLLGKVPTDSGAAATRTAKPGPVTVAQDTHPIYALNPAFIRDPEAPVATFWYAATSATKSGRPLTIFTVPDQAGTWHPVNVASGNTESRMTKAAQGTLVFTEPQIGAWYALTRTQVRPLNPAAVNATGPNPISIATYQDLVHTRYSDKLPNTPYNTQGLAGGYTPTHPTTTSETSAATSAETSTSTAGTAPSASLANPAPSNPALPLTAAALTLATTTLILIRRRKPTHP
ncbi:hypothetical protein GCM10009804_56850 [Kribbella hippodromi]|uniref:Uncharacterized protein n=1 Tax=Kribbella hippodromi TaxID=434347 RepID=A0ABN2E164_9ACTN